MSCPILDPPSISQKGRETTHQHGGWDALAQHKLPYIDLSELCRNVHVMDLLPKRSLYQRESSQNDQDFQAFRGLVQIMIVTQRDELVLAGDSNDLC